MQTGIKWKGERESERGRGTERESERGNRAEEQQVTAPRRYSLIKSNKEKENPFRPVPSLILLL